VNPGLRAHLALIGEIVRYLTHKKSVDFATLSEDRFADYVCEIAKPAFDLIGSATDKEMETKFSRKFGEGGVREYLYQLCEEVMNRHADFGSEEFKRYLAQRASDKIEDANRFLLKLSELMTNQVVEALKLIHGTKLLPSGDPAYWEKGIESRRVKDNAYAKQQKDPPERRKRKEGYLDVVDLKDIIEPPTNWAHFESLYSIPMIDEKKGKKHYTSWIVKFGDVRNIAAHKNDTRTFTDDDLEFVEWLRVEVMPRLERASDG
jgi:DNA sulfur modification protein DndB